MAGWIKFDKDMAEDPRLLAAASTLTKRYHLGHMGQDPSPGDSLRLARNALLGALVTLWSYADTHIRDDDTLPMSSESLDAFVGIDDFCSLMPTNWVQKLKDGTVKLPGYGSKNDLIAKEKRAADNKSRQARFRARSHAESNGAHNDRVTRNAPVRKCVDQDQDQDSKREPPQPPFDARSLSALPEWTEWIAHRKAKRFPNDPTTLGKQIKFLERYDAAIQAEIINTSIQAGWQGLFPLKGDPNGRRDMHPRKTRYEQAAERIDRRIAEDESILESDAGPVRDSLDRELRSGTVTALDFGDRDADHGGIENGPAPAAQLRRRSPSDAA